MHPETPALVRLGDNLGEELLAAVRRAQIMTSDKANSIKMAVSLNNLGTVLQALGKTEQALPPYQKALEMRQKLYPADMFPDGHPQLAKGLYNLGTAFDSSGNLYVTDDYTGKISEFSPTGQLLPTFATGLVNPFSLVFDNSGNLYVGKAGAFRKGATVVGSIPVQPRFRERVLAAGDEALGR